MGKDFVGLIERNHIGIVVARQMGTDFVDQSGIGVHQFGGDRIKIVGWSASWKPSEPVNQNQPGSPVRSGSTRNARLAKTDSKGLPEQNPDRGSGNWTKKPPAGSGPKCRQIATPKRRNPDARNQAAQSKRITKETIHFSKKTAGPHRGTQTTGPPQK